MLEAIKEISEKENKSITTLIEEALCKLIAEYLYKKNN
jgi:hypothetical protein